MRKELLLPIHVQLALLDRDCCQTSFAGCLSIWVIWAGPNPHPLSRVFLDEQLNWESQGSDLLKPWGWRRHGNKLPRAWPTHPRSATENDLSDLSSELSKLTTQFAHLCPESHSEIAWLNAYFRWHNLAWRYQEMERAYHEFFLKELYCPRSSKCVYQCCCNLTSYRFYLFMHPLCSRQYRRRSKRQQAASDQKTKRSHCCMQCPRRNECLKHPAGTRRKKTSQTHTHTKPHMHAVVAVFPHRPPLSL